MARSLYTNNAAATLASGITNVATTIVLTGGQGAQFPAPTAGNYFYGTLIDAATGLTIEIVKCTARTTDTLTVVRAQQGTSASSYLAGDKFELRVTAFGFSELAPLDSPTFTGVLTANGWAPGYQTIATSGGTTAFSATTPYFTFYTGTNTQLVQMPDARTLTAGRVFYIDNNSTGLITLQDNTGGALGTIPAGNDTLIICSSITTQAGVWDLDYDGTTIVNGKTFTVNNTLTLSGTDGSTLNMGTGGTLGTAAYTASTAYDASGAATSAVSTHAALQTGVHGISITAGKTFSSSNTLTLSGTDGSTLNVGTGGTLGTAAYTASSAYQAAGSYVTVNGALGTPSSGTLTNCTFPTLNQNTSGTAANLSGTPALPNGTTATTQAANDNSTKLATTAYADATSPIATIAKAWVAFNGANGTRYSSLNVTSVTRGAAGNYTVNFTSAFANTNYCSVATSSQAGAVNSCNSLAGPTANTTRTTSAWQFYSTISQTGTSNQDGSVVSAIFFA